METQIVQFLILDFTNLDILKLQTLVIQNKLSRVIIMTKLFLELIFTYTALSEILIVQFRPIINSVDE